MAAEAGELELRIPAEAAGTRLDRFLATAAGSRAQAKALIAAGRVSVDGRPRAASHLVQPGERITVAAAPTPATETTEEVPFAIPFEDEHLLVVEKPAGVVVHPARGHRSGTLAQALGALGAAGGEPWRPGIVHRLDRDTSGLLVVAKGERVHRMLKAALAAREVRREYTALVSGQLEARSGTVEAPIGRDRRRRVLMSLDTGEPREARTHFRLLRSLPQSTLLAVWLETGRTHQIRVHMAAIGHPICGDPLYGGGTGLGLTRQFLHASRLSFAHPITGADVDVRSPLPEDLHRALARAEGQDP